MHGLRKKRKEANLSQTELANLLGLQQHTVSNYELGKTEPSNEILKKMSELFGCHVEDLF